MALTTTHTDSLQINVSLQPPFPAQVGFSNLLIVCPVDQNNLALSSRIENYTQDQVSNISGDFTQRAQDAAEVYFAQRPAPSKVYVGYWNAEGGTTEGFDTAINDMIAQSDENWFFITLTDRLPAEQEEAQVDLESNIDKPAVLIIQSDDQGIVDPNTSLATPIGNIVSNAPEQTFGVYHPNDDAYADAAMAGNVGPFDADRKSAPFFGELKSVPKYVANINTPPTLANELPPSTDIGTAQSPGEIRGNSFNSVLPFGSANSWVAPGQNINGRQGKVVVTKYWFQDRLQNQVANEIQTAQAQGNIIPIGAVGDSQTEGQERMAKLLRRQYELGVAAEHFLPENLDITYPTIQQSDINQDVIPLSAEMTVSIGGQAVSFDIFFGREPV